MNGEQLLIRFTNENFQKKVYAIAENVYFFTGFGNSNATAVIGKSSVILIDALDCDRYAKNLRKELSKITPKPVRTIIYTHTCPDHTGGAGVFSDTVQEVIAFAKAREDLKYYDRLEDILNMRKIFARGYGLSDEDAITHGLGPREGFIKAGASQVPLEPTTLYTGKSVERELTASNSSSSACRVKRRIPFRFCCRNTTCSRSGTITPMSFRICTACGGRRIAM